jgi:hypothetical protein
MVDATDSKSVERELVGVRVPLPVPGSPKGSLRPSGLLHDTDVGTTIHATAGLLQVLRFPIDPSIYGVRIAVIASRRTDRSHDRSLGEPEFALVQHTADIGVSTRADPRNQVRHVDGFVSVWGWWVPAREAVGPNNSATIVGGGPSTQRCVVRIPDVVDGPAADASRAAPEGCGLDLP